MLRYLFGKRSKGSTEPEKNYYLHVPPFGRETTSVTIVRYLAQRSLSATDFYEWTTPTAERLFGTHLQGGRNAKLLQKERRLPFPEEDLGS